MRKNSQKIISGFTQIAQKNCVKLFSFSCAKIRKKIFPVLRKLRKTAQNSLRFMRKSSQKKFFRENSENFAQKI